ncbi:MAG: tyrosine-type recombinase/integrase [Candidatus Saccharimonadales bacterium]
MKSLVSFFGDVQIEDLTREQIRLWRRSVLRTCKTDRNHVIKLRVVLAYLLDEGYTVIPPSKIPVPQRPQRIVKFLTPEQVRIFIDANNARCKLTRARNKAIMSLLYSSGIRVSELCSLDKADVTGKNFFTITSKGGVAAPSFIDHRSQVYIMTYLRMRTDSNPALFLSENGNRIRPLNVQEVFDNVSRVTGIKATPHTMKHSFCTNLMRNGADIRYVQRLAKHKSIQTTEQYLHVLDTELQGLHKKYHSV